MGSSKHFYTMPGETNIVYKLCSSRFDMFNHNQQFSEEKKYRCYLWFRAKMKFTSHQNNKGDFSFQL